jgi:dienelactone hydrolase
MRMRRLGLGAACLALVCAEACASTQSTLTFAPVGASIEIPATLIKPDGDGPFPAVVVMHDCSGLGPRSSGSPARWAEQLVSQGFVVLLPDSFTPRGFADGVCTLPGRQSASANGYVRAADAYGALAALRALPFVDGKRVGLMGGSHGGSATLAAMAAPAVADDALAAAKRAGFAAAVALYPGCAARYGHWSTYRQKGLSFGPPAGYAGTYEPTAPLLILIGEQDDWTPAEPCRRLAEASRAAGHPVEIEVYPGAHHAFDSQRPVRFVARRNNASSPTGRGATTGGNQAAWDDAKRQVQRFFLQHLQR